VAASSAPFSTLTALINGVLYVLVSSTNLWVRQGSAWLLTAATKANTAAGDYFSITIDGTTVNYQLNVTGSDANLDGMVQVDIHTATDAESVVDLLVTAIAAQQASLTLTDNDDGTLTIVKSGAIVTMTEHVAHASFTVAKTTLVAALAAGSMFWPANTLLVLDGRFGEKVSVIRDSADGKATLTPVRI
jgi:hypothetical protein